MNLGRRLVRAAEGVGRFTPEPEPEDCDFDYWARWFEAVGGDLLSAKEPDFDRALAEYRTAVAAARSRGVPQLEPPPRFRPDLRDERSRRAAWQTARRFPDVGRVWWWLWEMATRSADGVPPVSEVEFAELAAWLTTHCDQIDELAGTSGTADAGKGPKVKLDRLKTRLSRGPRVVGAGRAAESVRRLQGWLEGGGQ